VRAKKRKNHLTAGNHARQLMQPASGSFLIHKVGMHCSLTFTFAAAAMKNLITCHAQCHILRLNFFPGWQAGLLVLPQMSQHRFNSYAPL